MGPRLKAVAVGAVAILVLLVGVSVATGQTFYNSESQLSPSYTRPYSQHYWNGASFNDSRGKELAFFYIAVSSDNQSQGPIGMTVSFGPNVPGGTSYVPLYIDSFQLTFSSVTFGSFPDVAVRSYSAQGGLSPTRISGVNGQAVVSYQGLGFYGEGTETIDLWFHLLGAGRWNQTVTMTVDFTAHNPHSLVIGESYSAEAVFHLVVEPSGSVVLSED